MKANTQVIIGVILIFLALILTPIRLQSGISIIADSGLPEDIQTAVNEAAAAGGGTVYIPEGTFLWNASSFSQTFWGRPTGVIIPGGVNVIGAGADKTVLKVVERAPDNALMFGVDGEGKSVRISGIHFIGYVVDETENICAIKIVDGKDFRVDHCIFENFDNAGISTRKQTATTIHRGVIDHNIFDNPYKDSVGGVWGYGVIVIACSGIEDIIWKPIDEYLGKYEDNVVYIEDNVFRRCRHAIASNEGGYYVARYNLFEEPRPKNYGIIDIHGASASGMLGGRGLEAYNNTIIGAEGYDASQAFWIRGGGGVIFNNVMLNILYGVGLYKDNINPKYWVKELYIWSNSMDRGILINNAGNYTENIDYFLYVKPNYTPYPYPHPLTLKD